MMRSSAVLAALLALTLAAAPARAQFAIPPADQPDLTLDAAARGAVLDTLCAALRNQYVFPETAKQIEKALRARQKKGEYDALTSAKAFADSLTSHLQAAGHDLHLHVHYSHEPLPRTSADQHGPAPGEREKIAEQQRRLNYGFERIQRLAGNVGYIELRMFDGSPEAGQLAAAAMTLLAGSDALIVDLRRNGGGDPNLIALILSYFFPADERVHINDFYEREGDHTEQFWTITSVPGPRYVGKDLYVLTSRFTGSGAEEFAYDVKALKRGTLIGETTAGAANPGGLVRVHDHFVAFIPGGRAINPITKTNWEGVGVEPDVRVSADEALKNAHVAALQKLIENAPNDQRRAALNRALEVAKAAPIEPLDLPGARKSPRASG